MINSINLHFTICSSRRLTLKLVALLKRKADNRKEKKKRKKKKRETRPSSRDSLSEIRTYRSRIGDRGGSMKGKGPHEGGGHLVVYRASSWYYLGARHTRHSLERLLLGGMILTNFQIDYHAMPNENHACVVCSRLSFSQLCERISTLSQIVVRFFLTRARWETKFLDEFEVDSIVREITWNLLARKTNYFEIIFANRWSVHVSMALI